MRTIAIALLGVFALFATPANAQSVQQFYKGRQVALVVGSSPTGAYDPYARLVARYLPKHLPGSPEIVVKNMQGAGGVRAANHLYNVAPKDGSELGLIVGRAALEPLFRIRPTQFDGQKFIWLGSANDEAGVCLVWHTSPITTMKDLFSREMTVGASDFSNLDFPLALNAVLGTKIRIRRDYDGLPSIMRAMERGEVHGVCGVVYSALVTAHPEWIAQQRVRVLIQMGAQRNKTLGSVPFVMDFAKNADERCLLELTVGWTIMGRPFVAPPGIPEERKLALRRAFDLTMNDQAFLAEATKLKLPISPARGVAIEQYLQDAYAAPRPLVERAAKILMQGK